MYASNLIYILKFPMNIATFFSCSLTKYHFYKFPDTVYPAREEELESSSGRRSALFWSQAFVEPIEPMGTDQSEEPEQNFQIEQENRDEDTQMGRDEEDAISELFSSYSETIRN